MTRENADAIAGVGIPSTGLAEVARVSDAVQSSTPTVTVPLFNVVDESDTTAGSIAETMSKAFGVPVIFSTVRLTEKQYSDRIEVCLAEYKSYIDTDARDRFEGHKRRSLRILVRNHQ
jgi:hypothetical protein